MLVRCDRTRAETATAIKDGKALKTQHEASIEKAEGE